MNENTTKIGLDWMLLVPASGPLDWREHHTCSQLDLE